MFRGIGAGPIGIHWLAAWFGTGSIGRRRTARALTLSACLVTALPVLYDLVTDPRRRPFGYLAADTFYYLTVARNIVERGSVSSDGEHAINGFHPLWQLLVTGIYAMAKLLRATELVPLLTVLVSLACVVGAVGLFGASFLRATRRVPAAFVAFPFGVYALLVLPHWQIRHQDLASQSGGEGPAPLFGTLYSFVNGMESGVLLLSFGLAAYAFVTRGASRRALDGVLCGGAFCLVALSRLDHAVLGIAPLTLWAVHSLYAPARRRFVLGAVLAFAAPLALYAVVNHVYAGSAMPLSGVVKSSFPIPSVSNLTELESYLKHPFRPQNVFRVMWTAPVAISIAAVLAFLPFVVRLRVGATAFSLEFRPCAHSLDRFLVMVAPGVVLLAAYNILFVAGVGSWYYPVSTAYVSLTVISVATRGFTLLPRRLRAVVPVQITAAAFAALSVLGFLRFQSQPDFHRMYADFCQKTAPRVRAHFGGKVPKLFEIDDGVIGYCLDTPAMSGSRLLLDAEALRASDANMLFQLAVGRGFRAVATLYYASHDLTSTSDAGAALAWARRFYPEQDYTGLRASVLFAEPSFTIVGLEKPERDR
jgi:hypothetical protein